MTVGAAGPIAPRVLFVCTGNVCRSPVAELLLRAGLGAGSGVDVASAGVGALIGEPVDAAMARLLRARGIDPDGFAARQLDPAEARAAACVLTMTTEQRTAVVSRAPAALRRAFTLREFVDLVELGAPAAAGLAPAERLLALVAAAPAARARRRPGPERDDIEDPYRRPDEVADRSFRQIDAAVARLVGQLRLGRAA